MIEVLLKALYCVRDSRHGETINDSLLVSMLLWPIAAYLSSIMFHYDSCLRSPLPALNVDVIMSTR
jgi:hypothetical protein